MITAVDTNVLLDVFTADATFGRTSRTAIAQRQDEAALVVRDLVLAELAAAFRQGARATTALQLLGANYVATREAAALRAREAWRDYRAAGGPRSRLAADLLIGAHAVTHAERLLTRDRGFFRKYFTDLVVMEPTPPQ